MFFDIIGKEERMPIYEFKCLICGHVFELLKLKKENEGLEMKCPKCSSAEVEKILSTMNIARSGSGKSTECDEKLQQRFLYFL